MSAVNQAEQRLATYRAIDAVFARQLDRAGDASCAVIDDRSLPLEVQTDAIDQMQIMSALAEAAWSHWRAVRP